MRPITAIVIHCSATGAEADVGVREIRAWHVQGRGWLDIGYHFVIRRSGAVEPGRPLEEPGAHVAGHNAGSIGLCLAGGAGEDGRPENNFEPRQWAALKAKLLELKKAFPAAEIKGHRDFPGAGKDCPCFDVGDWLAREGPQL